MSTTLRYRGTIADLRPEDRAGLLERQVAPDPAVRRTVTRILAQVRTDGDAALRRLARELDGVDVDRFEISAARRRRARDRMSPELRAALERAARNITAAHRAFLPAPVWVETEPGVIIGRRPDPLPRAGIYAPGGRAPYPSSVLMGAIPARVAGVREIVLCTPPGPDGSPSDVVLAAAEVAGVDRVFTATIPAVDCVVGPGNAWVAAAKLLVSEQVAIDGPAGPSELLIIADDSADVARLVAEMVAQAEHDPDACVVAVTSSASQVASLEAALDQTIATLAARADIVRAALCRAGGLLVARSPDEAVAFANAYAPEHLLLAVRDPAALLPGVRNAGTVFLGTPTSVVFGDYLTGANHVLPTGGAARRFSGLSTATFVRWTTYQETTPEAARRLADDVAVLARAEQLEGHAAAACAAGLAPSAMTVPAVPGARRVPQARAGYADITLHALEPAAGTRPGLLDLSDNVNLWGTPPAATAALTRMSAAGASARYPQPYGLALKRVLATALDVTPDMIVVGCGSDDVLDGAIRAFARPGGRLAHITPSFGMIPLLARANDLSPVAVPLTPELDADADRLLDERAAITYVCSPNNPTGNGLHAATLERIAQTAEGLFIVDEAYVDFADGNPRSPLEPGGGVLLTRTLSKAFGLAGLRIGYGVGAPEVVREIEKALGPYKLSAAAEAAAIAVLTDGRPWVEAHVADVRRNRQRLTRALRDIPGLDPVPSQANFVFIRLADGWGSARHAADALSRRHVVVRTFPSLPGIGREAIRVTVGPWSLMERLLDALRAEAPCG
jgi:histidinol dehydrogenase